MAAGDAVTTIVTIAQNNEIEIRPPLNEEWIIHNIYFSDNASIGVRNNILTVYFYNGYGKGALMGINIHVTNNYWIVIKNNSVSDIIVAVDGVKTR
ncbi:MAG: hypothetical protein QXY39_05625 [Thermofilaceae archaeon]